MKRSLSHVRVWVPADRLVDIGKLAYDVARVKTMAAQCVRAADCTRPTLVQDHHAKKPNGKPDWALIDGKLPRLSLDAALCREFPDMHSNLVGGAQRAATEYYRKWRWSILRGLKRTPEWTKPTSIPLRDRYWKIQRTGAGEYVVTFNPASRAGTMSPIELQISSGRMPPYMVAVLDDYASGAKKLPGIILHRREGRKQKRKWYLQIPYDIEQVTHERIAGLTLYVRRIESELSFLRCWIEFDKGPPWYDDDMEYESGLRYVENVEHRRKSIQAKYRCDDGPSGRRGHGGKRANETYAHLRTKRERQQKVFNFHRALHIVNVAIRWKCESIEIEDLRLVPSETLVLGQWPYFQIYERLAHLCEQHGIELRIVKPIEALQKEIVDGKGTRSAGGGSANRERRRAGGGKVTTP